MTAPIGHNGPPQPLNAKLKIERAREILERGDLTSAQKCIGVGIVLAADKDGVAALKTRELQQFASADDRETVFRATKKLQVLEIIDKTSRPGQSGSYKVMPAKIAAEIEQAFHDLQSGRAKADRKGGTTPVGLDQTGQDEPVGLNLTSRPKADQSRAYIESPSEILPVEVVNKNPLGSPNADELNRQAYEAGLRLKGGASAKSARSGLKTRGTLDGSEGITFSSDGKISVFNGAAAALAADFPRLEITEICNRAGPELAKFGFPNFTDAMTVLRKWGSILSKDLPAKSKITDPTKMRRM